MARPLVLAGNPNRVQLLAEARRLGYTVSPVDRTGEVDVIAPHGRARLNNRRKDGTRALIAILRRGQKEKP